MPCGLAAVRLLSPRSSLGRGSARVVLPCGVTGEL